MSTNSRINVDAQDVPEKLPIEVKVLGFTPNEKLGSTLVGRAYVAIRGVFPGFDLKIRNIAYFKAFEPDNPEDFGRAKFPQTKEGETWLDVISFENGKDKSLHFRILVHIRRAVEQHLRDHDPNGTYDLAEENAAPSSEISDSDIPF
jgi:hypothetical protein